jgi:REP element-mobilizing transposase RayT
MEEIKRGRPFMERKLKGTPPRLGRVYQDYDPPLYFVTFSTLYRRSLLANQSVFDAFLEYSRKNAKLGRAVGQFVIMPDHIHLFVRLGHDSRLNDFVRLLKQALTKSLREMNVSSDIWQPGFFDRLLRHSESYHEKWNYVRDNPVRAGLVEHTEDWPWQGEVVHIDRV